MDDFLEFMNEKISIFDENEKLIAEDGLASVSSDSILLGSGDFIVDIDYIVKRELPNGHIQQYRVIDPDFFAGMDGMPAHYSMKVENMKKPRSSIASTSVVNNIHVSDSARFYQDSVDNSNNTYNSYSLSQYQEALKNIKSEVSTQDLPHLEVESIEKTLLRIENELRKDKPNKDVLTTCVELLPTSVALLQSVVALGQMIGVA